MDMLREWIGSVEDLRQKLNQEVAITDYFEITQQRIDQFAEASEDRNWIHVDVERSRSESPFGGPIAHGFLTLSLLGHLLRAAVRLKGVRLGVIYGLNYARFLSVVPVGSMIRARIFLNGLEEKPTFLQVTWRLTVERTGAIQPACITEWLVRYYFAMKSP